VSYLFFEEKNILKTILRKYTLEKSQRNADTNLRKLKNADEKAYQMGDVPPLCLTTGG
jgi:hypothetical protein